MRGPRGVVGVHNLYLLRIDPRRVTLQAHVVVAPHVSGAEARAALRAMLGREFHPAGSRERWTARPMAAWPPH